MPCLARRALIAFGFSLAIALGSVDAQAQDISPSPSEGLTNSRPSDSLRVFGEKVDADSSSAGVAKEPPPVITAVAIAPDGTVLVTAGDDHLVNLWNIEDGQLIRQLREHDGWVRSVAFSPDGKTLASAGDDRRICLWNAETGELIRKFGEQQAAIYTIAFHPDGRQIAVGGFEKAVRLYDLETGTIAREFDSNCSDVRSVAFSYDGKTFGCGCRNGCVSLWDTTDGSLKRNWCAHGRRIRTLVFSQDGQRMATASDDRQIRIWDSSTAEQLMSLDHKPGKVMALCFCGPNQLASGGSDNLVRVWNLESQQVVDTHIGHNGSIAALAADPRGNMLVSGGFDTTVRLWSLNSSVESKPGEVHAHRPEEIRSR